MDGVSTRSDRLHLQCHVCRKTFTRNEHFSRHQRTHTKEKPHKCQGCEKSFSRLDTLHRHMATHEQTVQMTGRRNPSRACNACAADRIRCTRDLPCSSCRRKGRQCTYPVKRATQAQRIADNGRRSVSIECEPEPELVLKPDSSSLTQNYDDRRFKDTAPVVQNDSVPSLHSNAMPSFPSDAPMSTPQAQDTSTIPASSWYKGHEYITGPPFSSSRRADSNDMHRELAFNWRLPEILENEGWDFDQMPLFDEQFQALNIPQPPSALNLNDFTLPHTLEPVRNHPRDISGPLNQAAPGLTPTPRSDAEAELSFAETYRSIADSTVDHTKIAPVASMLAPGRYYVEDTPVRAAFGGDQNARKCVNGLHDPSACTTSTGNTTESDPSAGATPDHIAKVQLVSDTDYNAVITNIRTVLSASLPEQGLSHFPPLEEFRSYVSCYFHKFHVAFPFVHKSSFTTRKAPHWVVMLAVATVGLHRYEARSQNCLHPLLVAVLHSHFHGVDGTEVTETPGTTVHDGLGPSEEISFLQAGVLNAILLIQSGSPAATSRALLERSYLVERCEEMKLLVCRSKDNERLQYEKSEDHWIKAWLGSQSRLRTGLMIWLLDIILANQTNRAFRMQPLSYAARLPSLESSWDYPTAKSVAWENANQISLLDALESIWIEKRLPPNLSYFSHTLLTHAVYRRTREAFAQSQAQLYHWTPNALVQTRAQPVNTEETWPPTDALYNKWRNSACDGLDVLHWSVNSLIAKSIGWEHPTVLHLHLTRLTVLAPVVYLQTLATDPLAIGSHATVSRDSLLTARRQVVLWAIRDQFKARLCLIHAGSLYWHVRRYSVGDIEEPFGIYLATLVLWAYSVVTLVRQTRSSHQLHSNFNPANTGDTTQQIQAEGWSTAIPSETVPHVDPPFLYLDRPCDDEMSQIFSRDGEQMVAYLRGVGSITANGAPRRILREGIRLLGGHQYPDVGSTRGPTQVGGIQKCYSDSLARLETACI